MEKFQFPLASTLLLLLFTACHQKSDFDFNYYTPEESNLLAQYLNLPEYPENYDVELPKHLKNAGLFARPIERSKATLGRVLFYDKKLSKDGTIACADCHKQELGFADNLAFSKGVEDRSTARNSFALSSVANFSAYYGTDLNGGSAIRFFWDNRAETVAQQSRGSLTNPREMDMDMHDVVNRILEQPYYEPLYKKAFGGQYVVTEDNTLEAIANFINALGSYGSKFDQSANAYSLDYSGSIFPNKFEGLTDLENAGKDVYNLHCAGCHSGNMGRPVLQYANNGLDLNTSADEGVGAITAEPLQLGTFKVPTLRNIALTAPYMHDGRFKTLEEVLEHYNSGIQKHPNLHEALKDANGLPKKNFLDAQKKQELIAFLKTLTDEHLLTEAKFSNPFKR